MQHRIQQAGASDLDTLLQWRLEVLREVFTLPEGADLRALEQANRAYYQTALAAGTHTACFAFHQNEIIGCGGICFQEELPSPDNPSGRCGYLMNLYTRPAFRQHGVGGNLVRWLVRHAVQRGITKIHLEASTPSLHFYRHLGFAPMDSQLILPRGIINAWTTPPPDLPMLGKKG